ncbi:MAG TPA: DUF998 domain-containing protein [Nitrososphaerales archaeon]|nr:DUF998 domain-containing protein [Nitrososphaerales archaeon]
MVAYDATAGGADRARPFFVATIAGIALYVVLDAVAQSLPPHYSPISQAESDLAVGPYGYVMAVNFVNRGLFSLLFLYGLTRSLPSNAGLRTGFGLLGMWAVGSLILALSPTDVRGPVTVHGLVHLVVATLAFLGAAFGTLSLSRTFSRDPALKDLRYAMHLAILAPVFFFVLYGGPAVFPHAAAEVGGLVERVFIGLVLTWILAVSATMLRRSSPNVNSKPTAANP